RVMASSTLTYVVAERPNELTGPHEGHGTRVILAVNSLSTTVKLLRRPLSPVYSRPPSLLRDFSGFRSGLPYMLPPRLVAPQSGRVCRMDGARKPVETPPFSVQRSAMRHTPYRRGLQCTPAVLSRSMRMPPVSAKVSVICHS